MPLYRNQTITLDKLLTISINLLHQAFGDTTRLLAKRRFQYLEGGKSVYLATVRMDDGSTMRGIVTMTPTVQTFYDPDGNEGLNAVARIERESGGNGYLWVDLVSAVERLPNPTPPQPSNRIHPPDPNAPAR